MRRDDPGIVRPSPSFVPVSSSDHDPSPRVPPYVVDLHARCGIYTKPETVQWFLDKIGWTADADLTEARLLEPSCGDGAFLVEAVSRLCASYRALDRRRTFRRLAPQILAFELHREEATKARRRVADVLRKQGISRITAERLAREWIRCGDFLLADVLEKGFSHVVGNPPYVRWSKVPGPLKQAYENHLPAHAARGDLCLAFLERGLAALDERGRIGFLCSDRWLYTAYASEFRENILPDYVIDRRSRASETDVFESRVHAYPIKLVAHRRQKGANKRSPRSMSGNSDAKARRTYEALRKKYPTLEEAGCKIRVGPALGPERAFVGTLDELDVEPELLAPYVSPRELGRDGISWAGRYIVCMHDENGTLRDLSEYPKLAARLAQYRSWLRDRALVRNGAPWYRPIDRVRLVDWARPKLLVPEMTKNPRVILDTNGYVPSHGIYAIFAPDCRLDTLYESLNDEIFVTSIQAISPISKGGTYRCYKKFAKNIPFALK